MRQDVIDALSGRFPARIPCKESLNHPEFITYLTGIDVFEDTPRAFDLAWQKMGIDIHVGRPGGNAPRPRVPGGSWRDGNTLNTDIGVYPTTVPAEYLLDIPKTSDAWIYNYSPARDDIDLPTYSAWLQQLNGEFRAHYGALAVHYHLYYTTLFMWPIVMFGWEPFLLNAQEDPQRFEEQFWLPWTEISRKHIEALCAMDEEVVFTHDDLTMWSGPVFAPAWYERYIFPHYAYIWEPVCKAGKKLVFVCDGNLDVFLERLLDFPIDGIMYENPATPFSRVMATWGEAGRGFIGGISTAILTEGTPEEVEAHTREIITAGRNYPGFIISSCGQLPGNIPLDNMLAYCRTRDALGSPADYSRG